MRLQAFLLIAAPLLCLAQTAPAVSAPPEVDQALRARATKFLEYQNQGNFSKAFELVAADSRDYYFSAPKEKATSFTLDEARYSADFSTATIKWTMKRQVMLAGHPVELPQVVVSQWKKENGEWMWYHDPSKDVVTGILGERPAGAVSELQTQLSIPKEPTPQAALAAAAKIAPQAVIDRKSVTFTLGKESTEQVIFHNGNGGQVRVLIEVRGAADTMSVEPSEALVNAQADLPVKISYKPLQESALRGVVRFTVEPFGSVYNLPVRIATRTPAPKPALPAAP